MTTMHCACGLPRPHMVSQSVLKTCTLLWDTFKLEGKKHHHYTVTGISQALNKSKEMKENLRRAQDYQD